MREDLVDGGQVLSELTWYALPGSVAASGVAEFEREFLASGPTTSPERTGQKAMRRAAAQQQQHASLRSWWVRRLPVSDAMRQ